jgi:hypothetical protein
VRKIRKPSLVGKTRYVGNVFVVIQGILLTLLMMFFLNQAYLEAWQTYPAEGQAPTVYLKNIPNDKKVEVQQYLFAAAEGQGLFLVRRDSNLKNDGSFSGFRIGVYGNVADNEVGLSFMGQTILDEDNLKRLLASENQRSTLGVDRGSVDSLEALPYFRLFEQTVVMQLPQLISDSDAVDGAYHIIGLSTEAEAAGFLEGLSLATGLSGEELLRETSGSFQDTDFRRDILFVFTGALVFLNIVSFLVIAVRSLEKQGKLTLLGWSRGAFAKEILGPFLLTALVVAPFTGVGGWLLAGWDGILTTVFSFFILSALMNLLLTAAEATLAAVVIMLIRPLDAIHGRIPKKALYAFGVFAYLFVSAGSVLCGYYVDGPGQALSENAKLSRHWRAVSGYQVLNSIAVGQDTDSITGQSKQLDQDIYDWYSFIAEEDGVYLIKTQYYDNYLLGLWRSDGIYSTTPTDPFWLFTVSPNYLASLGMEIDQADLEKARTGARLYLLPDTLSTEERNQIIRWISEDTTRSLSPGDIQTKFTNDPKFEFVTYRPDQDFFTWGTTSDTSMEEEAPIIYVATPENMRYFETESLRAIGFDGYLKFADTDVMDRHTQTDVLSRFGLSDNELSFLPVQGYIDGLQKGILLALSWFGGALLVLVLILIGLLLTLATIFRIANQEKIQVKKYLGFSFWQLYRAPLLSLATLSLLSLMGTILLQSKLDFLLMSVVAIIQGLIFWRYMSRGELKQLMSSLKES